MASKLKKIKNIHAKPGRRAAKSKALAKNTIQKSLTQTLEQINNVLGRLEGEVEVLLKKLVKQGERSGHELKRSFDDLVSWVKNGELISVASGRRGGLEKEVRRLAEEVLSSVKEVELLPQRWNIKDLIVGGQRSFNDLVEALSDNGVVHRAKLTFENTRRGVLSVLSIPTQAEVEGLEKKIVRLEKKLTSLTRKAA